MNAWFCCDNEGLSYKSVSKCSAVPHLSSVLVQSFKINANCCETVVSLMKFDVWLYCLLQTIWSKGVTCSLSLHWNRLILFCRCPPKVFACVCTHSQNHGFTVKMCPVCPVSPYVNASQHVLAHDSWKQKYISEA